MKDFLELCAMTNTLLPISMEMMADLLKESVTNWSVIKETFLSKTPKQMISELKKEMSADNVNCSKLRQLFKEIEKQLVRIQNNEMDEFEYGVRLFFDLEKQDVIMYFKI